MKNSAGENAREGVRVTAAHLEELKDSRGTANFALKWEKDSRKAAYLNVVPVKGYTRTVTAEDDGKWVPLVGFDCRGMDVTGWHPEVCLHNIAHRVKCTDLTDTKRLGARPRCLCAYTLQVC